MLSCFGISSIVLDIFQNAILSSLFLADFLFSVDFSPPDDGKMKIFIMVGALALVLLIFFILGILWWKGCLGRRISREEGTHFTLILCANLGVEIRKDSTYFLQPWQEVGTMYKLFLQGVIYFLEGVPYKDSIQVFFRWDNG